jgi:hypothetical protein
LLDIRYFLTTVVAGNKKDRFLALKKLAFQPYLIDKNICA